MPLTRCRLGWELIGKASGAALLSSEETRPRFGRSCLTCDTSTLRRSRPPPQPQRLPKKRRFRFQCLFNAVCQAHILQLFFSYFVAQMPTPPLLLLRLTSSDLLLPHVPAPPPISTCNFPNSIPPRHRHQEPTGRLPSPHNPSCLHLPPLHPQSNVLRRCGCCCRSPPSTSQQLFLCAHS